MQVNYEHNYPAALTSTQFFPLATVCEAELNGEPVSTILFCVFSIHISQLNLHNMYNRMCFLII
jgi:hypothetical protein